VKLLQLLIISAIHMIYMSSVTLIIYRSNITRDIFFRKNNWLHETEMINCPSMIKQIKLLIIIKCFTGDIMTFLNTLQIYFALCFNLNIFCLLLNIINPLFSYQKFGIIYKSGQINSQRNISIVY